MEIRAKWGGNILNGLKWMAVTWTIATIVVVFTAPSLFGYIFISGGTLAAVIIWAGCAFVLGTLQKWYSIKKYKTERLVD